MCLFSEPVQDVADTSIFARADDGRQFLVYSMKYAARAELAMLLPLPVPPRPPADAVQFLNLERYASFFEDIARGFPAPIVTGLSAEEDTLSLGAPPLVVHDVGSFEASFVPRREDFARLDRRFRLPAGVAEQLPMYRDYGFAVFKLKPARSQRQVHPMAFSFPRRHDGRLFFPTVHVHDGALHATAHFDHVLYCQPERTSADELLDWEVSEAPAAQFVDIPRSAGIVAAEAPCRRLVLEGVLKNEDVWVGR